MKLGQPIAAGRTAEIYPWRDGMVLKLFHTWMSAGAVQYEARIARAVCGAGLPVPQVGEIVEVEGRVGLEYERLTGKAMGEVMESNPQRLIRLARQLAELQIKIHQIAGIEGVPLQTDRLRNKIHEAKGLPHELQEACLQALAGMPEGNQLCHGDFHPLNILMTANGPIVIDWVDATSGAPLADVARTAVLLHGIEARMVQPKKPGIVERGWVWIQRLALRAYNRAYLQRYFELCPGGETEYRRWCPIIAAGRMSEDIPGLNDWLRKQVEIGLNSVKREM